MTEDGRKQRQSAEFWRLKRRIRRTRAALGDITYCLSTRRLLARSRQPHSQSLTE
jgi:hypothetical protein